MSVYIFNKGNHMLKVFEMDTKAKVEGLKGWIDSVELIQLLIADGYKQII